MRRLWLSRLSSTAMHPWMRKCRKTRASLKSEVPFAWRRPVSESYESGVALPAVGVPSATLIFRASSCAVNGFIR